MRGRSIRFHPNSRASTDHTPGPSKVSAAPMAPSDSDCHPPAIQRAGRGEPLKSHPLTSPRSAGTIAVRPDRIDQCPAVRAPVRLASSIVRRDTFGPVFVYHSRGYAKCAVIPNCLLDPLAGFNREHLIGGSPQRQAVDYHPCAPHTFHSHVKGMSATY